MNDLSNQNRFEAKSGPRATECKSGSSPLSLCRDLTLGTQYSPARLECRGISVRGSDVVLPPDTLSSTARCSTVINPHISPQRGLSMEFTSKTDRHNFTQGLALKNEISVGQLKRNKLFVPIGTPLCIISLIMFP